MAMSKVLKPYTIIPPNLYVHRDADRQIKNIINDMGRPGYVLVSRQMGKTNLLLNAKRELESPDDVFVYIDLSNGFDTARSCFENIIDIAIETNLDRFESVNEIIHERRANFKETPPHKQHVNELRMLLKVIPGKLVIILDEIDALTKTIYSDQIFAQIRSIYFSRVNFPELEKLTYILSGVIEPNEIIKDQKISPFNIGQKIFLNDFNRLEFNHLLANSKLDLEQHIVDRIFYWTGGNPRMTWDVCSEIENMLISNTKLDEKIVDEIVKTTYLIKFDKPPIDHIRELIENNRDIRNSIIEIEYSKGKQITDKIKSKLYLAGIINYEDNDVHIKNETIKQALNLEWIKTLEEEDKGLVGVAIEEFEKGNYEEALEGFERFLEDNEFEEEERAICFYYMGYASYSLGKFKDAINFLNKSKFDVEDNPKWYYRNINLTGNAYYYNLQISNSISCYKEVIDSGRKDETYVRSLVSYGNVCLESDEIADRDKAVKIYQEITSGESLTSNKLKESFISEIQSIANFNLGQFQLLNDDSLKAAEYYRKAVELTKDNIKPTYLTALIGISADKEEQQKIFNQLIALLDEKKIEPVKRTFDNKLKFSLDDLKSIAVLAFLNFEESVFNKLIPHLKYLGDFTLGKHLHDLAIYLVATRGRLKNNSNSAVEILKAIRDGFKTKSKEYGINEELKLNVLKALSYLVNTRETPIYSIEYVEIFENQQEVDEIDLEIFANLIYKLSEQKKYKEALRVIKLIDSKKELVSKSQLINYLVIYNLELNIYYYTNDRGKSIEKAKEIIDLSNDELIKKGTSNLLGETGLDIIRQNAETILRPKAPVTKPLISQKKYGRNQIIKVRYKDGSIVETKFKKVEKDLNSNECFILN